MWFFSVANCKPYILRKCVVSGAGSPNPVSIELNCPEEKSVYLRDVRIINLFDKKVQNEGMAKIAADLKAECRGKSHCVYYSNEYSSCTGSTGEGAYDLYIVYMCIHSSGKWSLGGSRLDFTWEGLIIHLAACLLTRIFIYPYVTPLFWCLENLGLKPWF